MSQGDPADQRNRFDEMAGVPAPRAGEEVVVETQRREVVVEGPEGRGRTVKRGRSGGISWDEESTKEDLVEVARALDVPGRSSMSKDELMCAIVRVEDEAFR
jgi:hypothetical protein